MRPGRTTAHEKAQHSLISGEIHYLVGSKLKNVTKLSSNDRVFTI
jgi:hypothetical protein